MAQYHRVPTKKDEAQLVDVADRGLFWIATRWRPLVAVLLLFVAGIGFFSWQRYQRRQQAQAASQAYFVAMGDTEPNLEALAQLTKTHASSFLGQTATFRLALAALENDTYADARTHLEPLTTARDIPDIVRWQAEEWIAQTYALEANWAEAGTRWQALLRDETRILLDHATLLQKTVTALQRAGLTDAALSILAPVGDDDPLQKAKETQRLWLSIAPSDS
jgi:hypothetical protein